MKDNLLLRGTNMVVNPLSTPPIPVNSNLDRGMFVWVTSSASQDPLDTDTDQTALLNFCGTNKVNVLFLDMWVYLGGANWTATKLSRLRQFLDVAHKSGIKVYALTGNIDWAINHSWVMKNIVQNLQWFNEQATSPTQKFDGVMLDVEYWTDTNQTSAVSLPGLCDLIKAFQNRLGLPVGVFTGFYLKDNTSTWATVDYNGKNAQDGEHLMDVADFCVVGTYRDHASDNGTDGPGQISLFQPWYDYASQSGKNFGLFAGSETTNVSPAYITYFGATKASMETEHTLISNAFQTTSNSVFMGQAVHSYDGWKAMS